MAFPAHRIDAGIIPPLPVNRFDPVHNRFWAPALERRTVGFREQLSWESLLIPKLGAQPGGPGRRRQRVDLHGSKGGEACQMAISC